ncbi:ribosome biogenesis protein ALB1 [Scheffersomyces coipomensis]|uniref:ribosome biogenesis protein ALB1 n=1 Tax=Scheffersomyces coipomensis TaxID=1788519 RepID=UPI00315CA22F
MASKNSINKPKNKINAFSHAKSLAKKRAARAKSLPSTRSSLQARYADKATTAIRPTDSKAVALYTGESAQPIAKMTNTTLSNKRAKKIARNQKYIAQRKQAESGDSTMEVESIQSVEVKQSNLDKVKVLLWSVIETNSNGEYKAKADGEGTTLGIQAF